MIEDPPALTIKRHRPRPTDAQIAAFQGVPTGFVADALGGRGALSPDIQPIGQGRDLNCVVAGPAMTALNGPGDILATVAALEVVTPGDVLVAAVDAHQGCSAAGDRVIGMLRNAGGRGFVTDGPVRDYAGIVATSIPTWCTGLCPASPYTSGPAQVGVPVQIGGQQVCCGDMIVGDRDGVVVVPLSRIPEVIETLEQIKVLEARLDAEVADGRRSSATVRKMFEDGSVAYLG